MGKGNRPETKFCGCPGSEEEVSRSGAEGRG